MVSMKVVSVGRLTDHYNPQDKTVNLSPDVYNNNSVAAAAIAAHECGMLYNTQLHAPVTNALSYGASSSF